MQYTDETKRDFRRVAEAGAEVGVGVGVENWRWRVREEEIGDHRVRCDKAGRLWRDVEGVPD